MIVPRPVLVLSTLVVAAAGLAPGARAAATFDAGPTTDVVVTATRIAQPRRETAANTTVITGEDIERHGWTSVADALRDVPGLSVVRTGGPGQQTSVFMRGANSEHTLVLMDGIPLNDPSGPTRAFDFATLPTDNIDRIEVVRGPQSTLYGSDALGGVIQIFTRRGRGPLKANARLEAGSYRTRTAELGANGATRELGYSFSARTFDTEGVSQADWRLPGNVENDAYNTGSVSGRLDWNPAKWLRLDSTLRYIDARADLDDFGGPGGDDRNNVLYSRQLFYNVEARTKLMDGRLEQRFSYAVTRHHRHNLNPTDPQHVLDSLDTVFDGTVRTWELQNDFKVSRDNTFTLGYQNQLENADSSTFSASAFGPFASIFANQFSRLEGVYVQDVAKIGHFTLVAGGRHDDHSRAGGANTYRVNGTYAFGDGSTRLVVTSATGFKAPSLFQLLSVFGSPGLRPEKVRSWDASVEKDLWNRRVTTALTYFSNDFSDLITFDPNTFIFSNISRARTHGVEASATARVRPDLKLVASFTRTDTEDLDTGMALLRRERNKGTFSADYRLPDRKTSLVADLRIVGRRFDTDFTQFPSPRVVLPSYTVLSLSASHRLSPGAELTLRAENLTDTRYEEVFGFGTLGRAVYIGSRIAF